MGSMQVESDGVKRQLSCTEPSKACSSLWMVSTPGFLWHYVLPVCLPANTLLSVAERTQLGKAEAHEVRLQLALLGTEAAHDDAFAAGDLLVSGVDQVGQGLEGVGCAEPCVPVAGREVHRGVDHQRVCELLDGHVLQHGPLVVISQVCTVLRAEDVRTAEAGPWNSEGPGHARCMHALGTVDAEAHMS